MYEELYKKIFFPKSYINKTLEMKWNNNNPTNKSIKGLYQTIKINNTIVPGLRDSMVRLPYMDLKCNSFLDLGCNVGSLSTEAYNSGAKKILGIDIEEKTLLVARIVSKGTFIKGDYRDVNQIVKITEEFFNNEIIDIICLCSIYNETEGNFWSLLENLNWKNCYVESHIVEGDHKHITSDKFLNEINTCCYNVKYIAKYNDPHPRFLWKLTHNKNN